MTSFLQLGPASLSFHAKIEPQVGDQTFKTEHLEKVLDSNQGSFQTGLANYAPTSTSRDTQLCYNFVNICYCQSSYFVIQGYKIISQYCFSLHFWKLQKNFSCIYESLEPLLEYIFLTHMHAHMGI